MRSLFVLACAAAVAAAACDSGVGSPSPQAGPRWTEIVGAVAPDLMRDYGSRSDVEGPELRIDPGVLSAAGYPGRIHGSADEPVRRKFLAAAGYRAISYEEEVGCRSELTLPPVIAGDRWIPPEACAGVTLPPRHGAVVVFGEPVRKADRWVVRAAVANWDADWSTEHHLIWKGRWVVAETRAAQLGWF